LAAIQSIVNLNAGDCILGERNIQVWIKLLIGVAKIDIVIIVTKIGWEDIQSTYFKK
jgi:hypothetical protein